MYLCIRTSSTGTVIFKRIFFYSELKVVYANKNYFFHLYIVHGYSHIVFSSRWSAVKLLSQIHATRNIKWVEKKRKKEESSGIVYEVHMRYTWPIDRRLNRCVEKLNPLAPWKPRSRVTCHRVWQPRRFTVCQTRPVQSNRSIA